MFRSDVSQFLSMVFSKVFNMASIHFPGTSYPIWGIFLSVIFTAFLIRFLLNAVGAVSIGSISSTYKGGNNKNIKTSDKRKHDQK